MGRGARLRPPPSAAPSIVSKWPLPVSALNAIPFAASQSIVHSIRRLDIAVQQKSAYTRFEPGQATVSAAILDCPEPVVSSTSFIGGFSPRLQGLGLFSAPCGHLCHPCPGVAAAYDALPQSSPHQTTTDMATSARKDAPKRPLALAAYLQKILTARVYDVAIESALDAAPALSTRLANRVLFKREDTQAVFSFKLRGAYNKMAHLAPAALARGVICASAGNHAQGVALAARRLGCQALVVMPTTTPSLKVAAVRALGAEVVLFGDSYSDAYAKAMTLEQERGLTFVHPFDDPDVIAGQGTIAMEILRQHQGPIDAVFVAVGGGGLISGIASYVKAVRPEIRVVGVQMNDSDAMIRSIDAGERVELADVGLFSDGTAVKRVGVETFRLARE